MKNKYPRFFLFENIALQNFIYRVEGKHKISVFKEGEKIQELSNSISEKLIVHWATLAKGSKAKMKEITIEEAALF